ncbi:uncharacterized protein LOC118647688 [Monomorium pharaonis]|uniref:uncharacterized protein LOC118645473 n=1 Tax=Monomorium pharaonis TaxID=307658 RepID=UPI00174660A1|nr:uncharacterized protein LOC118645473 [Monomorium pharaonis]XP_036144226.1 uncharacterized protein LOC118646062 [Monomorium pharaonis]XP_036147271.1 uncharacterized protein LOC118647120 [Monomorium pharaonis]XP_036148952.1 uncharacterized protein LOC118647688 [Monomorium pharaonis]
MNYYVPIQQNETCDKPTISQPHHTPRILGRRFALTTTFYKYLDIGISVGLEPFVEMILGDNKGNEISLSRDTWVIIIEKRTDIEQLLQSTTATSLWINDLFIEVVKIRNESIIKFTLNNKIMYMKPSTVQFLLNLEDVINNAYFKLWDDMHIVKERYNQFVNCLRRNNIHNKCDAVKLLNEICVKTSLVDCELMVYASDNIVYDALQKE